MALAAKRKANQRLGRAKAGFTLIEILMAMFIMALGVVGVMSLFPVGLESVQTAMDSTMTDIIGRTGMALMNCYLNASEVFDQGCGEPERNREDWTRRRMPSRAAPVRRVNQDLTAVWFHMQPSWRWRCGRDNNNLDGFYLRFVGEYTGHTRRIGRSENQWLYIDTNRYDSPCDVIPRGVVAGTKLVVTRYGFPTHWKPLRVGKVGTVSRSSVSPVSLNGSKAELRNCGWRGDTWRGGQYYILFTSGNARGRLLRVSGGINNLNIRTEGISLLEDEEVKRDDTFAILGAEDVFPCVFPPNISNLNLGGGMQYNETRYNQRFQTPPTVPYYTRAVPLETKKMHSTTETTDFFPAEYSYLCIISTANAPQPGPWVADPEEPTGMAKTARVDVVVFRNYSPDMAYDDGLRWLPLEEQPRAIGVFTGFISPM